MVCQILKKIIIFSLRVVLRPGQLIYYRTEKKEDCFGLILLSGCEIAKKEQKKSFFSWRIYHPEGRSIYSTRGLKGENLVSAKLTGNNTIELFIESYQEVMMNVL